MTARDDLFRAAEQLEARGVLVFSPAEVLAEARAMGSAYPDSTLRSMMVFHLKVDADEHGATPRRGGFQRVEHGRYRRVLPGAMSLAPPSPAETTRDGTPLSAGSCLPPPSLAPTMSKPPSALADWRWEGNVQSAIVAAIVAQGWRVRRVSDTASKEHGIDVEAERDGHRLLIEVKGYPGSTRTRGERAGESKDRASLGAQARHYFGGGILTGLLMRADHPEAAVVVAFPSVPTYENLRRRLAATLAQLGIEVWLMSEDGVLSAGLEV